MSVLDRWTTAPIELVDNTTGVVLIPDDIEERDNGDVLAWLRVKTNPDPAQGTIAQRFANFMLWAPEGQRDGARVAWLFPFEYDERKAALAAFWSTFTVQVV